MSDPSYALQVAEAAKLLATSAVTALVSTRVYSAPAAKGSAYPWIQIGQYQPLGRRNTCHNAFEVYSDVHIWAAGADASLVAKQISSAVIGALAPSVTGVLTMTGFQMKSARFERAQHLLDKDPTNPSTLIAHSVVTFKYEIVPEL